MKLFTTDSNFAPVLEQLNAHVCLYPQETCLEVCLDWKNTDTISWSRTADKIQITCKTKADALAGLGRALQAQGEGCLTPRFAKLESMIDVSRNAVYTVSTIKRLLCQMALMGYTGCLLYMEDTYELPGYPYWGYHRGRYSTQELKEMDDFADLLGLELIPCIQTLAHLRTALRWDCMADMRDTADNLMVGAPGTIQLVKDMLAYFKQTFRTNRIHLGMDESCSLGMGRYRFQYGFRDHRDLIREHLKMVCDLCKQYDLKPMIWDDMLFRDDTPEMGYYGESAPVTPEQMQQYPDNLSFVYWDYYHNTKEEYLKQLNRRGCLDVIFAGGIWKWGGWTPNFTKSFRDTVAALEACIEKGVQEVIVTAWGDDGAEAPIDCLLPGWALFGLNRFADAKPQDTQGFCKLLADSTLEDFMRMEYLDLIPSMPKENLEAVMPHKMLLYGDLASELFLPTLTKDPQELVDHYAALQETYQQYQGQDIWMQRMMDLYAKLAQVLTVRCQTSMVLRTAWEKKDADLLQDARACLKKMVSVIQPFHDAVIAFWSASCKGQGLEVLNLRLGGLQGRCMALEQRLGLYLQGTLDTLTELDEKTLVSAEEKTDGLKRELYGEIVTVNTLYHPAVL